MSKMLNRFVKKLKSTASPSSSNRELEVKHPSGSHEGCPLFEYDYIDPDDKRFTVTLKQVFADKLGNTYYSFHTPMQMTSERAFAAFLAEKQFFHNTTFPDLAIMYRECRMDILEKKLDKAMSILADLEYRLNKLISNDTTMELAAIYFLINDEHPGVYSVARKQEKLDLWKQDDKARAFFLRGVLNLMNPYMNISPESLVSYLNEVLPQVEAAKTEQPEKKRGLYNISALSGKPITKPT